MPSIRCPRCGAPVAFTAADATVSCPGCQNAIGIREPAGRARNTDQDKAISSAMKAIGAVVLLIFAVPVAVGLWRGQDGVARESCRVESSPPGAEVLDGEELLGLTPLTVEQYRGEPRLLSIRKQGFLPISLYLPEHSPQPSDCVRAVSLPPLSSAR